MCLAVSKGKCVTLAVHWAYSGSCQNTDSSRVCKTCDFGLQYQSVTGVSVTQVSIFCI